MRRAARPDSPKVTHGYLDLVGSKSQLEPGITQRLMVTDLVPTVYERWWRPVLGRIAKGPLGLSMQAEYRTAENLLALEPGDTVLDVACGPGNFTRRFSKIVGGSGLAIGSDLSESMLTRATKEETPDNTAYIRASGTELPFREGTIDAVCCFAALHMFDDPMRGLDQMHRVLRKGGRIAILTSCRSSLPIFYPTERLFSALSGMRVFGREEIVTALEALGFKRVSRKTSGAVQLLSGVKA